MKRTLFLLIFILAAVAWALIVLTKTAGVGTEPMKAWGLALLGAFWISASGLRLYVLIGLRVPLPYQPIAIMNGKNSLEPCQMGHREPYVSRN